MTHPLFNLTGRTALVTGGTHGLGMAIAAGLAEAGATIVINDILPERLSEAVRQYAEKDIKVHAYQFDVTDEEKVFQYLDKIGREVGPVDILVNNAGIIKRIPMLDLDIDDWRQVLDIDLTGPFIMSKYTVLKFMLPGKSGKIINMCSMMSELGRDTVGAYAAAKGGLKMLTRSMATEWAKYNIQANGIGPGYFATSQTAPLRVKGHPFNEFIINRTPAARWGEPEDLKGAAIFLASAASDFVNGQIIYVDGGILATIGKPHGES